MKLIVAWSLNWILTASQQLDPQYNIFNNVMWIILHLWMKLSSISASAQTQALPFRAAFELSAYYWPFALCTLFVGWGKHAGLLELASRQAALRHNPSYCLLFFPLTRLTIKSLQHTLTVCSQASPFCTRSVDSAAFFSFFPCLMFHYEPFIR